MLGRCSHVNRQKSISLSILALFLLWPFMSVTQTSPLPPSYSDTSADVLQEPSQLSDFPPYRFGRRVAPTRSTYQAIPKELDYQLKRKEKLVVMTIVRNNNGLDCVGLLKVS